jgi:mRNA interferase HigB
MKVLGLEVIEEFKEEHANSRKPLDRWVRAVEGCSAGNFVELKQTFPSADQVKQFTVFDVGGNKFRVISGISFAVQALLVNHVFTHNEYDKWKP